MRGRALAASRSALTRPPQTSSGLSLRATRFDNDAGGDDGDGGDDGGDGDGVMRKCAAEDLGPHMCVCARPAEVGERKRQKSRGDSGLSAGHTTTTRMAQVGTQQHSWWHK